MLWKGERHEPVDVRCQEEDEKRVGKDIFKRNTRQDSKTGETVGEKEG